MTSITVNAKLFGTLRDRVPGNYDHEKGITVLLHEEATIQDLLHVVGLSERETGFFTMNGVSGKLGDRLNEGDEVCFFLPLAGG
jgi:hypothetical protein